MDKTIELAKGVSIELYLDWEKEENKIQISEMVYQRFYERYIKPYSFPNANFKKEYKNGFAMMGSACLMIESYMAFKKGEEDTKGIGRDCFCEFLNTESEFSTFKDTSTNSSGQYLKSALPSKFYYNVRCGILHQGETKEGWTITRENGTTLFDKSSLTVNAYLFLLNMDKVLKRYESELKKANWNDIIWEKLRDKFGFVIKNCQKNT